MAALQKQTIDGGLILPVVSIATAAGAQALTLDASYSGKIFACDTTGGAVAYAITLPSPLLSAGFWYRFSVVNGGAGANITITSPVATSIKGVKVIGAGGATAVVSVTLLTIVAGTATASDRIDLFCDGTNWKASVQMGAAGGIT